MENNNSQQEPSVETELFNRAVEEIGSLRGELSRKSERLQIYENMMSMFLGGPQQQGSYCSPDIVFDIKKHLEAKDHASKVVKPS